MLVYYKKTFYVTFFHIYINHTLLHKVFVLLTDLAVIQSQ